MSIDLNPDLYTNLALDLAQQPLAGFPEHFFILDCETTGGRPVRDRMTELAWIEIRSGKIAGHYNQLFDPDIAIPPWIQKLTGISNRMIEDKPFFKDCADEIYEKLNDQIIMAHNARFDYGFLKNEFRRMDMSFHAKTFCSVKLSRALFPELKGHGLDKLIKRCDITLQSRHRAMTDVLAVLAFLRHCISSHETSRLQNISQSLLKRPSLPSHLDEQEINRIPHQAGVYYFYDDDDNLLYVGKSVDLRTRVMSHFVQDHQSSTDAKLSRKVHHIDFTTTISDFGAQLLEAQQIKALSPSYNQRLRRNSDLYQILLKTDEQGFSIPEVSPVRHVSEEVDTFGLYKSKRQAKNFLRKIAKEEQLCQQIMGLEPATNRTCFAYQLKQCKGACCGEESATDHNQRLIQGLEQKKRIDWPWQGPVLVTELPSDEQSISQSHLIDQWCYFGVVEDEESMQAQLEKPLPAFDLDMYHILVRFLFNHGKHKPPQLKIGEVRSLPNNGLHDC